MRLPARAMAGGLYEHALYSDSALGDSRDVGPQGYDGPGSERQNMKLENIRIDSARARILCIDDDADIVATLAHMLLRAGYACETCRDAASALASVRRRLPDLILADINLGEDDGLALCQQIRSTPQAAEVPVIFLSGAAIPDIVRRSQDAGGTYYVAKPFDVNVLLELVETSLWMPHIVRNRARHSRARQQPLS